MVDGVTEASPYDPESRFKLISTETSPLRDANRDNSSLSSQERILRSHMRSGRLCVNRIADCLFDESHIGARSVDTATYTRLVRLIKRSLRLRSSSGNFVQSQVHERAVSERAGIQAFRLNWTRTHPRRRPPIVCSRKCRASYLHERAHLESPRIYRRPRQIDNGVDK